MEKNVKEWIENESKEDTLKIGMSLKAENYKLPMIKLTFGDQILPIPQVEETYVMAKYGYEKLKDNIVNCNNDKLKKIGVNIFDGSASKEEIYKAMGEVLKEVGPYDVIERTFYWSYDWEMDNYTGPYRTYEEVEFTNTIGEDQEWKVESKEPNEDTDEKS